MNILDKIVVHKQVEVHGRKLKKSAASQEKESTAHVATYRRIRNVLEGYVESVQACISTCQSNLRSMTDEARLTNSGNQQQ